MLLETVTLVGSTLVGAVIQLMARSQQNKRDMWSALARHNDLQVKEIQNARSNHAGDWVRHVIALLTVFCVIALPKLVILFMPGTLVTVSYTQFNPGSIFSASGDIIKFITTEGVLISPLDTEIMSAIVGLYFGKILIKHI